MRAAIRNKTAGAAEGHGGDGVLDGGRVELGQLLAGGLSHAAQGDGIFGRDDGFEQALRLGEGGLDLGAPGVVAGFTVVGDPVVVARYATDAGIERVCSKPGGMEPVGEVPCSGHRPVCHRGASVGTTSLTW